MSFPFNSKWFWIIASIAFLIITHQVFWCPIHGDGAFYALVIKQATQHPGVILLRGNGVEFFDHPWLFFYYASLVTKILGVSDLTVKIPNFLIAGLTFFLMVKMSQASFPNFIKRSSQTDQSLASWAGLIAILLLVLTGGYEHQTRQPSIDPTAHFVALGAVFVLIKYRSYYGAGLLLGLAFMTKGAEMMSHLAALMLLPMVESSLRNSIRHSWKNLLKSLLVLIGVLTVIAVWFGWDRYFGIHWFEGYYQFQFANRFFSKGNMSSSVGDLMFFKSLLQLYGVWLIPTLLIHIFYFKKNKSLPQIWTYYWVYLLMTNMAFFLIKKDSAQHYTGIYIFGSISLAQGLVYMWSSVADRAQVKWLKAAKTLAVILLAAGGGASGYFWTTPYNKKDIWLETKRVGNSLKSNPRRVVVIDPKSPWAEQMYWNLRWYSENPIYWCEGDRRPALSLGEKVFIVSANQNGDEIEVRETAVDLNEINTK